MHTLVLVLHILAALGIVVLVLLQHGKGADMGAAFGSGSAGSLFGSAGASNFLSRTTAVLAAVFFATSLGLTYFSAPPPSRAASPKGLQSPAGKAGRETGGARSLGAGAGGLPGEVHGDPEVAVAVRSQQQPNAVVVELVDTLS